MAKQKRLNKNLIAFLTVMGVILIVSVVALVIRQGAQRDPEVLAQQARDLEQTGDLEKVAKAAVLYHQAYTATRETDSAYLLDAARCFFKLGGLGGWLEVLQKANSKNPNDQGLIVAVLKGLCQMQEITGGILPGWEVIWRDWGEKLLKLDPENVLGLVCRTQGLWKLGEDQGLAAADESAQKAYELQPTDPRVARTYAEYLGRQTVADYRKAMDAGANETELKQRERKFMDQVEDILSKAVAEHPGEAALVIDYAANVQDLSRRARNDGDAARADELLDKAGDALEQALTQVQQALGEVEQALAAKPSSVPELRGLWDRRLESEWQLPALHVRLAQYLQTKLNSQRERLSEDEQRALLERIGQQAVQAVAIDPAMYDAYILLAQLKLQGPGVESESPAQQAQRLDAALEVYDEAATKTLILRSLRAALTESDRLRMLHWAFRTALGRADSAERLGDAEKRKAAVARAKGFLDDARTRWSESPLTHYMQGQLAVTNGDRVEAIQAFERSIEKQPKFLRAPAMWWLDNVGVNLLPLEHLAILYSDAGQLGEGERCADLALREYQELGRVPPLRLLLTRADLYERLDRPRAALDLLDQFRQAYLHDQKLVAARASLLSKLGRKQDAIEVEKEVVGADANPGTRLWQARQALEREDSAQAEELVRGVLDDSSATDAQFQAALVTFVSVLDRADRRDEARQYVRKLLDAPPRTNEAIKHLCRLYDVALSENDKAKRAELIAAKQLEMIAENPDPLARAEQYYGFYVDRGQAEKALEYLQELRKLRPDNVQFVEREFRIRLKLEHFDRAKELLVPLSQSDDGRGQDRVGGATYRGQLALARGDAELAIRELRQAVLGLPKSADLQIWLGRAYLMAGRSAEGIEAIKQAIAFNPRSADGYGLLTNAYDDLTDKALGAEREEYAKQASHYFEVLSKLAPDNPFVVERRRRAAEDANPRAAIADREKKRTETPDDMENLRRLGDLYGLVWLSPDAVQEGSAKQQLIQQADAFYAAAIAGTKDAVQLQLAQQAAIYFARSVQREKGETFLREFGEKQTGPQKVSIQLLLARFLESQRDPDAAERAYQRAQELVAQEISAPEMRQRADLQVGLSFVEFYQRWAHPPQVVEVCRWMLDRLPEKSAAIQDVRQRLMAALFETGQLGDMEGEIGRYVQEFGEDVPVLTLRVRLRLAKNQRETARQDMTTILQKDPQNVQALLGRAGVLMKTARYDEARADLTQAKALIGPGSQWEMAYRSMSATLNEQTGQLELATSELLTQLDSLATAGAPPEQQQQVVGSLVRIYRKAGQLDRAQKLVSEYMEKRPDEPTWPLRLGRLLESRADAAQAKNEVEQARRDYVTAAGYFERAAAKAIAKNPSQQVQALAARMNVLVKAGRPRDALDVFQRASFERMPPALRLEAAKAYWALNERDAAVEQWRQTFLEAAMGDVGMIESLAGELGNTMRSGDAERLLRSVAEGVPIESPPGQRLRIALAEQLARANQPADATPVLSAVLEKAGANTPERRAALVAQARVQELTGQVEAAMTAYRQILDEYGEDMWVLNNLAYLLVTTETPGYPKPQEALQYAERLEGLAADSENATDVLDTVGWVYFKYALTSGSDRRAYLDRAVAMLEQSLGLAGEPSLTAYEHLGQAYAEVGRTAEARTTLSRGQAVAEQKAEQTRVQRFKELLSKLR